MRLSGTKTSSIHQYRGLGDQLWDLGGSRPSLDLRFADSKSLVDATTGSNLVTFTRASSGTFVGSDGVLQTAATDAPRFDHNPTTGESLGLLVEEQRTNLLLRSEEFDNASWSKFQTTVTANATTAPDGSSNADSLIESAIAGTHVAFQNATTSASATQTFSVYAKANQRSRFQLYVSDTGANAISGIFNLSTGAVISATNAGTGSSAAASVISVGNGWHRCILTGIPASSGATVRAHCYVLDNSNNQSYTGDGTSGIFLWGAQLEAGAFPTSYIPTTTTAVTRSADVASISGSNFSAFYRQDAGAFYAEAIGVNNFGGATRRYYEVSDGTANNRLLGGYSTTSNNRALVSVGGVTQADIFVAASPALSTKHCFSYSSTSAQLAVGGVLGTEDNSTTLFTGSVMCIGSDTVFTTGAPLNGTIRRLAFWRQRLPNNILQTLTQ